MNFVLDCSITMAWLFEDQAERYTEAVLESLEKKAALVPFLWSYEVANALAAGERRKIVTASQSTRFLELLHNLQIAFQPVHDLKHEELLLSKARNFGLSSYDASYLALAMSRGLPLATRDKALLAACSKAGVEVYRP
ncbi:MAG TPA: type II toxin-antitoxin system VapC family toxin [bacterium]|nr:type II toxin-antitoxin system VapC family toxin [bacterium]